MVICSDLVMADAPRVCGGGMSGLAARSTCAGRALPVGALDDCSYFDLVVKY